MGKHILYPNMLVNIYYVLIKAMPYQSTKSQKSDLTEKVIAYREVLNISQYTLLIKISPYVCEFEGSNGPYSNIQ